MTSPLPPPVQPSLKQRLGQLFAMYGQVAIYTYVVLAVLSFAGAYLAIRLGWQPQSIAGQGASLGAAYVLYKVGMPVRVAAALLLTPLVARALVWLRGARS